MNNAVQQQLLQLVRDGGSAVYNDYRSCENLLRDICPYDQREVNLLVFALKDHVIVELSQKQISVPFEALFLRLVKRLCDNYGLAEDAATWAVESWALALEVISAPMPITRTTAQKSFSASAIPQFPQTNTRQQDYQTEQKISPQTIVVAKDGSGHYTTISEAIRYVPTNTKILVRPGIYYEGLVLDKELILQGDGSAESIIVQSHGVSCVSIRSSQAEIHDFTLRCTDVNVPAVDIAQGYLTVTSCDITSCSDAIVIQGSRTNAFIRNCRIHDAERAGVLLYNNAQGTIEHCHIYNNHRGGIESRQGSNPIVRHCDIYNGQGSGVFIYHGGRGLVEDSNIYGNDYPNISIQHDSNPIIQRSRIHHGKNHGVQIAYGGRGTVENCHVFSNARAGIDIKGEGTPIVKACYIYDNGSQDQEVYLNGLGNRKKPEEQIQNQRIHETVPNEQSEHRGYSATVVNSREYVNTENALPREKEKVGFFDMLRRSIPFLSKRSD